MTVLKPVLLGLAVAITLATAVYALTHRIRLDDRCAQICVAIDDHAPLRIR